MCFILVFRKVLKFDFVIQLMMSQNSKIPCYICASRDHMYHLCPHKINLRRTCYHMECHRCYKRGHMTSDCTDAWRQFRWTTERGRMVIFKEVDLPPNERCCCNCGKKGHFAHHCNESTMDGNVIQSPFVGSYDEFTDDEASKEATKKQKEEMEEKFETKSK